MPRPKHRKKSLMDFVLLQYFPRSTGQFVSANLQDERPKMKLDDCDQPRESKNQRHRCAYLAAHSRGTVVRNPPPKTVLPDISHMARSPVMVFVHSTSALPSPL